MQGAKKILIWSLIPESGLQLPRSNHDINPENNERFMEASVIFLLPNSIDSIYPTIPFPIFEL